MPSDTLTDKELKVVTYIEQQFWLQGGIPSDSVILNFFPDTYIDEKWLKRFWAKPVVRDALVARGVRLAGEEDFAGMITPRQAAAANMMLNLNDKGSEREKLAKIGVTTQQWAGWLREPGFQAYLKKRAENLFAQTDHEAYRQLALAVKDGNLNAVKLHFEMRNIYTPKLDVNVNIQHVLTKILEIIQVRVGDPETLELIANDLEALELGAGPSVENSPALPVANAFSSDSRGVFNGI